MGGWIIFGLIVVAAIWYFGFTTSGKRQWAEAGERNAAKKAAKTHASVEHDTRIASIRCPSCGGADLKPIKARTKARRAATYGVFALGSMGKAWQCRTCKTRW